MEILGLLFALLLAVYFLPTVIALRENPHRVLSIFLFNLALGWTVVGWVLALVWPAPVQKRFAGTTDSGSPTIQQVVVLVLGGWSLIATFVLAWQNFQKSSFEHYQSLLPNGLDITAIGQRDHLRVWRRFPQAQKGDE